MPYKGVRSPVLITSLLDLPKAIPLDYMHLVLLGIFQSLTRFWFDSKARFTNSCYIGNLRICKVKHFKQKND